MTPDTKLTLLIMLWLADKIIMAAIIRWQVMKRNKGTRVIITKDFMGRVVVTTGDKVNVEN